MFSSLLITHSVYSSIINTTLGLIKLFGWINFLPYRVLTCQYLKIDRDFKLE